MGLQCLMEEREMEKWEQIYFHLIIPQKNFLKSPEALQSGFHCIVLYCIVFLYFKKPGVGLCRGLGRVRREGGNLSWLQE